MIAVVIAGPSMTVVIVVETVEQQLKDGGMKCIQCFCLIAAERPLIG
jgi:hypothetical protein